MVYLHVPFCRSFCTYCDFYSEIACRGRDAQSFELYAQALCAEASRRQDEIAATRDLNTLYIGGGTPSVLPLSLLRKIIAPLMPGGVPFTEFTIEVNPEDIVEKGADYVRELLALGVNRVSMGVQSLDDGILRWMNRRHDAARARQAFAILRDAGVQNISVDLIFGISQLSEAVFAETLREVLAWRPEHVSAYQLSIEGGSALAELVRKGRYSEAPQEQCAAQYRQLCDALRAAGYVHYEISNWALPGHEAVHNSAYWTRSPYVGLGPGAHSFDGTTRSWNPSDLQAWLRQEIPASHSETLSDAEAREERIFLGLRTAQGIAEGLVDPAQAAPLLADGRLVRTGSGRLRIPEEHWFVSDDIIADLI
jgi:oxygen-independent coproporphyrinogen-3 oxidase